MELCYLGKLQNLELKNRKNLYAASNNLVPNNKCIAAGVLYSMVSESISFK